MKTESINRVVDDAVGEITLTMRRNYAQALCLDTDPTLDDLSEAVTTLEDVERIARRVLGSAHPDTAWIEQCLQGARAALRLRTQ